MITRPMLAATVEDIGSLRYPLLATPKIDGIRCLRLHDGRVVSRSFKPIPSRRVRALLEGSVPWGCDGEILIPGVDFNGIQSVVMSHDGWHPEVRLAVFDYVSSPDAVWFPYDNRMNALGDLPDSPVIDKLIPVLINNQDELLQAEETILAAGYEGIMLRKPNGRYKCGRSTLNEGLLLKFKRFVDAEAVVIGFEEKEHNAGEAEKDAFGLTKRSHLKANQVAMGTLGAMVCRDLNRAWQFNIGTGFTDAQRDDIWARREELLGKIVNYQYQDIGKKDKPRFPSFRGFRHPDDL